MNTAYKVVDTTLLTIGTGYALANIQTVLGIAVLCVQLGWLLTKFVIKLTHKIRDKADLSELDDDVASILGGLNDISKSLEGKDNERDNKK